jgi:hypothetical protein
MIAAFSRVYALRIPGDARIVTRRDQGVPKFTTACTGA